jgi:protein CpxP
MKASLLARVAPALLLSSALAGGLALPSYAQSASPNTGAVTPGAASPGSITQSQGAGVPTTGSAAMSNGSSMPQTGASMPRNGTSGSAAAGASTAQAAQPRNMQQMVAQRIADLHSQLHITSAQEPKWNKFAAVMRNNARQLDQAYQQRADKLDSMNALQNMESYARIEKTRVNDVQKLVPAFRTLYASLSPQQKKTADELFRARAQQAQEHHQASSK